MGTVVASSLDNVKDTVFLLSFIHSGERLRNLGARHTAAYTMIKVTSLIRRRVSREHATAGKVDRQSRRQERGPSTTRSDPPKV